MRVDQLLIKSLVHGRDGQLSALTAFDTRAAAASSTGFSFIDLLQWSGNGFQPRVVVGVIGRIMIFKNILRIIQTF
ncbi:hypothetical protein D9M68_983350 [compost metagenome]